MSQEILDFLNNIGIEINKCVRKPVIFDTGPLLILLFGKLHCEDLTKNNFTKEYSKQEFQVLLSFSRLFSKIVVTPQILAEVSNLMNIGCDHKQFFDYMNDLLIKLKSLGEYYVEKDLILKYSECTWLGITDVSLLELSREKDFLIFTKDLNLERSCISQNIPVVHFDKIRACAWT